MVARTVVSTKDLTPTERTLLDEIRRLQFGRFENLVIHNGQVVLDPWPKTVRFVKFAQDLPPSREPLEDFGLRRQVVELFQYVRHVGSGEIRRLEVRHGLPFSLEIEHQPNAIEACDV